MYFLILIGVQFTFKYHYCWRRSCKFRRNGRTWWWWSKTKFSWKNGDSWYCSGTFMIHIYFLSILCVIYKSTDSVRLFSYFLEELYSVNSDSIILSQYKVDLWSYILVISHYLHQMYWLLLVFVMKFCLLISR